MAKKQPKTPDPKRWIRFDGVDKTFEISKATAIKADIDYLFHVDRLPDGTVRITYNAKVIPELSMVPGLTIVREPEQV